MRCAAPRAQVKQVLEQALMQHCTLTEGDTLTVEHAGMQHVLQVGAGGLRHSRSCARAHTHAHAQCVSRTHSSLIHVCAPRHARAALASQDAHHACVPSRLLAWRRACLQVNKLQPEQAVSIIDTDIEAEVRRRGCYRPALGRASVMSHY